MEEIMNEKQSYRLARAQFNLHGPAPPAKSGSAALRLRGDAPPTIFSVDAALCTLMSAQDDEATAMDPTPSTRWIQSARGGEAMTAVYQKSLPEQVSVCPCVRVSVCPNVAPYSSRNLVNIDSFIVACKAKAGALKVRICITLEPSPNDAKSSMHFIKWIQLDGGDVIYEFPPEFQPLNSKHKTLLQIPTVKSVLKTLTRRGSYRIIAITLPATTVPLYFDDNGNSVFEEYYLEEKDLQKWKSETYPVPTGQGPSQLSSEAQNAAILEILQKLTAKTEEPQPPQTEENSARLLEPLHSLLRKNAEFVWTEQCQESFESVKKHLCSQPILAIFDPKLKIIIETDASGDGVGAVLKQVQESGEIKPVAYFSKKLKDYQKKKKAIYLECLAMKEAIKFWQHWLVGATFQIITDHKPLEALKINSRSDEELGDMLLFLSQFDFRVTYRPGSTNMEADCLSRNPVIEDYEYLEELVKTVNFLTLSDITTDQENHSSEFNKIGNTRKESGIIYKIKNTTKRIVISESLADALIKQVHLDFGHIGSAHVIKKIRQFYYTKNLDSKVKAYCQSCELCIKNKTRNSSSYGYLSQLGPARAPFEIVSLDTIGGFAGNRSSKRYLHLLVDHFTRYAFISTSKNQTADDFVKLIKKVQDKHQIKTLLTDQYSGINSAEFKSYLKREGINLIFTAVNNPASNGLNERLNQTLVNRIRCKINSSHGRAWSRIAEECVQEYNSTDHSVTTFSPEYLLFGKTSPIVPNSLEPKSDIIRDREAAFENTVKNHNYNKRLYDRNRRHHDFKEGDLVYVDHSSKIQRNKLEEIRIGPLKINKKISNTIFELDTGHRKKESNMFHVSKLVPLPVGGGI
ncbi:unnamed protein product [Nesidiocoris tenuis]|uniref:RNA-directed DNA polymerase n=1 Tax=Nesidiocoris tenuis TaxID=355587 RepID=A0A6H5GGG1_9HEMI|nr:unnamed protein product [Nesidiocoris tenuis]